MRLVFFGPPGAGKGTQARLLKERFHLHHISTGDLLRTAIRENTPVGQQARAYIEAGELVPDDIVNRIVMEALEAIGCDNFILDGYPRTIFQAKTLDTFLEGFSKPLQVVISLEVRDEVIVARLSRRRVNKLTGENYHLDFNPPPPDVPPELIIQREDDRPEVIRQRLEAYKKRTEPLKVYYRKKGILREINGEGTIEEVFERILRVLKEEGLIVLPSEK